jgi:hypothetical protein
MEQQQNQTLMKKLGWGNVTAIVIVVVIFAVFPLIYLSMNPIDKEWLQVKGDFKVLSLNLGEYKNVCGKYPLTDDGLSVLSKKGSCENFQGFPSVVENNHYAYVSDGSNYLIKKEINGRIFIHESGKDPYEAKK